MNRNSKSFAAIAAFYSLLACALFACCQKESERNESATVAAAEQLDFLNLDPKTAYVSDEECAPCHSEIYKSFKQTGMGRSFYPPSVSNRIEDFARNNHAYDARKNLHYEAIAKGEELFQIEYRLDEKGRRTHELVRKINYVVGSGNHGRTYLTEENGFLYEMPLTWYTQKRKWDLNPGFEHLNYRFSRPITAIVRSVYVIDNSSPGDLRVASHGQRLTSSACYIKSNGKLGCITCHNPHQPVKTVARSFFNETCLSCHSLAALSQGKPRAQHDANGDCVACHMPQGKTSDVGHVNFTEHWIQKEPAVSQTARAVTTPRLKDFFGEKDAGADLRLGMAYLQFYDAAKVDRADFERALYLVSKGLQNDPTNEEGLYRLGLAYFQLGRLGEAMQQFRALIKIAPQHALGNTQLAMVLDKMGRREEAVESYRAALRIFPENVAALTELGNLYMQLGKSAEGLDCFQKASAAQPSHAPAHNALGEFSVYARQDLATAKQHFMHALRLDPDYI
ncbi:tetratricopeptide repeat protein [candidate division KSB1 bacterium]|nr:tetratricopeptide repeat protein [candidate division KSB1 bacterium]